MYYENFDGIEDIKREYELEGSELDHVEIIYASYMTGPYDGESLVLFKKEGKLFLVNATHCSCYGLEGQWCPVEMCEESLKKEIEAKKRICFDEFEPFINFCYNYFKWERK